MNKNPIVSNEGGAPLLAPGPRPEPVRTGFRDLYFEEYVAAFALAVVVGAVSWGVVTRYVSHTPSIWTGEVARIAFAWTVFIGSAAGFRRSEHIVIDVLLPLIPDSMAQWVRRLSDVIVLVVLAVMTLLSVRFTVSTYDALTTVLRLPQSVIYAASAFGFALMTFRHVQRICSERRARRAAVLRGYGTGHPDSTGATFFAEKVKS